MKFRFVLGIAILASITQIGLAADRRIKDITDTATSAAADDYLIIDGTTNGTRNILTTKLPVSEAQQTALDGKAGLTGTSAFLSGAAVTFNAGSSATFNGTLGGTPTGGTLDLSLVTVSLGSVTVDTLNVTAFGTGILPAANGGAGTISGILKANGSGTVSAATSGTDYEPARATVAQAAAEAGTSTTVYAWTPERVAQAIAALAGSGSGYATDDIILRPTSTIGTLPSGFLVANGTEGTVDLSGASTALSVATYLQKTTGIAPTVSSAAIGTDGETLTITMSESVSGTDTAGGGFALTASGGAVTLGDITGTSSLVSTTSRPILDTETLTLAYVPGDYVDGIGLALAAFSGAAVTNNSEETASVSYLIEENFEETGLPSSGAWTVSAGSILWDYTTSPAPFEGTQSARSATASDTTYATFTGQTTVEAYAMISISALPASNSTLFGFRDSSGNALCLARVTATGAVDVFTAGADSGTPTVTTVSSGTKLHVWLRFVASGTSTVAWSTDGTRPTSGNNFTSRGSSSSGTAARLQFGGQSFALNFDRVLIISDVITSNP